MRRIALYISLALLLVAGCTPHENDTEFEGDVVIAYLCSLADDSSQRIKSDVWIEGSVVLNDKLGETYKSFVLYDTTAGISVKVDVENVDRVVPLYSKVRIRCEGLYIGREGERVVLGAEPMGEYVTDRIPESEIMNRMEVVTEVDANCREVLMAVGDVGMDDMLGYIRIEGVALVEEEVGMTWCDADYRERPFDSSLRHFTDGRDTLTVALLNRCHYATGHIPEDIVTLVGIVDCYDGEPILRLSDRRVLTESNPNIQ